MSGQGKLQYIALRGNAHLIALSLAGTYPEENLEPEQYTELPGGGHLHVCF